MNINFDSEEHIDIIKSFLGALIGGFFAVYGAKISSDNEFRKREQVRLREEVYIPLYNEHIKNYNYFMHQKSFFPYTVLKKKEQKGNFPVYSEWESIQADSRYLTIPKELKKLEEEIRDIINKYFECITNVKNEKTLDEFVYKILNNIVEEELDLKVFRSNPGLEILRNISLGKSKFLENTNLKNDYFLADKASESIMGENTVDIDAFEENKVKEIIYEELKNQKEIKQIIKISNEWIEKTEEILNYLEYQIKQINYKNKY